MLIKTGLSEEATVIYENIKIGGESVYGPDIGASPELYIAWLLEEVVQLRKKIKQTKDNAVDNGI